jgi:hypothetical protein
MFQSSLRLAMPSSLQVVSPELLRAFNVLRQGSVGASGKENEDSVTILTEVDPAARANDRRISHTPASMRAMTQLSTK